MNWNIDDPRWTAYLLAELSPQESADAEAVLKSDPALRRDVEALRETLALLHNALAETPAPALDDLRREAVLREKPSRPLPFVWIPTAAAAALLVMLGLHHAQNNPPQPEALSFPAPAVDAISRSDSLPEAAAFSMPAEQNEGIGGGAAGEAVLSDAFSAPAGMDKRLHRSRAEATAVVEVEAVEPATAMMLSAAPPDPVPSPSPTPTNRVEQINAPVLPTQP
jgi:anti-sigma factor RsiW